MTKGELLKSFMEVNQATAATEENLIQRSQEIEPTVSREEVIAVLNSLVEENILVRGTRQDQFKYIGAGPDWDSARAYLDNFAGVTTRFRVLRGGNENG